MDLIAIITTTSTKEEAERLARKLVEERLAACVQVSGPIVSFYRWQGALQQDTEYRCWIKTRKQLYPRVEALLKAEHSYQEPQIIAVPICDASPGYSAWLAAETVEP
ncbi:MAG: cation tolerance protein CutA [Pirellulaceae bacterium]|nr:MAG: cation tolerance protein CutA [Pirellulaceae bacterium]